MATIIRRGFGEDWKQSDKTINSSRLVFLHQDNPALNKKIDQLFPEPEVIVDDWTNIGGKGAGPVGPEIETFHQLFFYSLKVIAVLYGSAIVSELGKRTVSGIASFFSKSYRPLCLLELRNEKTKSRVTVFVPKKANAKDITNLLKQLEKVLRKKNVGGEFVFEPKSETLIEINRW